MFVTRFAPSPTGYLHKGHAFSALTAFEAARAQNGRFLLRMEDIDATRCKPEYEAAILEDLAWLGIRWEEPVRRQSQQMGDYRYVLVDLERRGFLYRCFLTRKEIAEASAAAPHGQMESFRGAPLAPHEEGNRINAGEPFAFRLSLAGAEAALGGFGSLTFTELGEGPNGEHGLIQARPEVGGDVILARKDVGASYHLAVAIDDALQGVTEVIRGQDLFEATHVQRLLQALTGLPTPNYRHHRLITDANGRRFAKRDEAQTLRALRESGVTAADLRAELGFA